MPNDLRAATWSAGEPASRGRVRRRGRPDGNVTLVTTVNHGAGDDMQLSARNQIPARVTGINAGEAIANVELEANGVRLVASITVEAVRQLGLAEGSEVTAVIKASDVIIAVG
jgi:molybdopterin-binding protein